MKRRMKRKDRPEHQPVPMLGPYTINGQFDAEVSVEIMSADGLLVAEIEPFIDNWTAQEIATVHQLKASWSLLKSARALLAHTETCLRNALSTGTETDAALETYLMKYDPAAWQMILDARAAIAEAKGNDK